MIFEVGKRYMMESTKRSKYWHEIEIRYIVGSKINFIVVDSFNKDAIDDDHTFDIDGAFFREYQVLSISGGDYINPESKKVLIDLALQTKDKDWFNSLVGKIKAH